MGKIPGFPVDLPSKPMEYNSVMLDVVKLVKTWDAPSTQRCLVVIVVSLILFFSPRFLVLSPGSSP